MKGKYKLLVLPLISLFASLTVVSAKEMTIKEIGAKVDEADKGARSAFIIGTHIFSGNRELTTEDIMVGAWTIGGGEGNITNPSVLRDKMSINVIRRSTPTSDDWYIDDAILGNKLEADTKVDVNYVNYNYNGETVNTDTVVSDAVSTLNAAIAADSALKDNVSITYSNGTITVKTVSDTDLTTDELVKLLKTEIKSGNYSSIKLTQIVAADSSATAITAEIKDENDVAEAVAKFIKEDGNLSFTIEFVTADGIANQGAYSKYSVKFTTLVNTDKFFINNKTSATEKKNEETYYVFDCVENENGNCTLSLDLKRVFTITGADSTAIAQPTQYSAEGASLDKLVNAIAAALEEAKSVTVKIGTSTNTFTSIDTVESALKNSFATNASTSAEHLTYVDLLNQKVTITIVLDETTALSQNDKTTEVYEFTITGTTDTNEEVSNSVVDLNDIAYDSKKGDGSYANANDYLRYTIAFDETTSTITFKLGDTPTIIPFSSDSNLADVISDLYFSGLYKSITLKGAGVEDFVINETTTAAMKSNDLTADSLSKGDIFLSYLEWLVRFGGNGSVVTYNANGDKKTFTTGEVVTNSQTPLSEIWKDLTSRAFNMSKLVGKTITLELEYVNAGVKNESGVTKYTIKFASQANTDDSTSELVNALTGIASSKPVDKDSTTVVVDLSEIDDLATKKILGDNLNSTLQSIAMQYKNVKVTLDGTAYTIKFTKGNQANGVYDSYGDLDNLVTALNNKLVNDALRGKEITVEYTLLENTANVAKNGEKYTIKFNVVESTKKSVNDFLSSKSGTLLTNLIPQSVLNNEGEETNNYIDGNTITLDVKGSYISLHEIKDNLNEKLLELYETGNYESITFIYNGNRYLITYIPATEEPTKRDAAVDSNAFISALGSSEYTTLVAVANNVESLSIEFKLANGVIYNDSIDASKPSYSDETTITYNIVLSTGIDVDSKLNDAFRGVAYEDSFNIQLKNDKINVLNPHVGKINNLFNKALVNALVGAINADDRIKTFVLKFGDNAVEINNKSTWDNDVIDKVRNAIKPLKAEWSSQSVLALGGISVDDLVEALGTKKVTLTVNLDSSRAVVKGSKETSKTYEFNFDLMKNVSEDIKEAFNAELGTLSWKENKTTIIVKDKKINNNTDITVNGFFTGALLDKLFAGEKVSSINVYGLTVSKSQYANIKRLDAAATGSTNMNTLLSQLNGYVVTHLNSVGLSVSKEGKVSAESLIGQTIEFTVNMAEGVLSENANSSETVIISFVADPAVVAED